MEIRSLFLLIGLALLAVSNQGAAQGTAFSYQGRLNDGGNPANGLYDVRFTVLDASTNGNLVAGPLTNSATGVTNGLFTVTLDFGTGVFTGTARWLQLDVQTNGGGAFTTLLPLQPIQPVPYAIMANTASNLLGTLSMTQLSGKITLAQLPAAVVTNNSTSLILNGTFSGGGSGLTNLNYNNITNRPAIPSTNNLVATNDNRSLILTNAANSFAGVFRGNGAGLTNLTASVTVTNLPSGTLTNNSSGVVLNGLTTVNNLSVTATNFVNYLVVSNPPTLNGSAITNLNASQLSGGVIPLAQLPSVVITNNSPALTIGGTNAVAPLTVLPKLPTAAIGSVSTVGALDHGELGGPDSVAVAGRYAYVVNSGIHGGSAGVSTLQVFDVSNPSSPVLVGSVETSGTGGDSHSVAVSGRYAYVVNFSDPGVLQIYDVSNPSSPAGVGSVSAGSYPYSVAVSGRYAYVANRGASTLQIFDVSTPSTPVGVGSLSTGNAGLSVAVSGRYAYVVDFSSTLQVVDVSNPSAPIIAGSVGTGSELYSVAVSGRYAYVVDVIGNTLQVFDVSVPSSPVGVGSVVTGSEPYFVAVAGRYAYVANATAGTLQLFDVSIPSSPVSVGSVNAGGWLHSVAVSGRYAYVANNGASTLQVFDLGGAYIQQFEAGAVETGTLQTRDTVTVGNNLNVSGGLTVSGSALISGGLSVNNLVGGITTNILIGGHMFFYTNGVLINIQ